MMAIAGMLLAVGICVALYIVTLRTDISDGE